MSKLDLHYIHDKLKETALPGFKAQYKMAPPHRADLVNQWDQSKARESAVLVLLYPKNDELHIVYIQRPTYKGVHSGQIAFPGGKLEREDQTLWDTAMREAQEEVGIDLNTVTLIQPLTPLPVPVSNFIISPFLAITSVTPFFVRQEREVKSILELNLVKLLFNNSLVNDYSSDSLIYNSPFYATKFGRIWGATAMITAEVEAMFRSSDLLQSGTLG